MEDFIPNPANYVMKGSAPKQASTTAPEIDPGDVERLESMDHAALVALVRRMACQCGLVAMMTKEETAQAMLDTLAHTALKPIVFGVNMKADIQSRMTAIDKWLDREKGKAPQSVAITGPVEMIDTASKEERMVKLARAIAFIFASAGKTIDQKLLLEGKP